MYTTGIETVFTADGPTHRDLEDQRGRTPEERKASARRLVENLAQDTETLVLVILFGEPNWCRWCDQFGRFGEAEVGDGIALPNQLCELIAEHAVAARAMDYGLQLAWDRERPGRFVLAGTDDEEIVYGDPDVGVSLAEVSDFLDMIEAMRKAARWN